MSFDGFLGEAEFLGHYVVKKKWFLAFLCVFFFAKPSCIFLYTLWIFRLTLCERKTTTNLRCRARWFKKHVQSKYCEKRIVKNCKKMFVIHVFRPHCLSFSVYNQKINVKFFCASYAFDASFLPTTRPVAMLLWEWKHGWLISGGLTYTCSLILLHTSLVDIPWKFSHF